MSSPTWTPAELSSSARPAAGRAWRVVEAQHRVSTLKLVDTPEDQAVLERLIDETKPPVPPECRHLDYLLFTPFRYGNYRHGSRFRRPGNSDGVFYASDHPETAMAEIGFYRLLFHAESPGTPWPANASSYTAFAVQYATERACDLTRPPLAEHRSLWTDLTDYSHCQSLADTARESGIEAIRYESVRDPRTGPTSPCSAAPPSPNARRSPGRPGGCWCPSSAFAPCASPRPPRSPGSAPPSPPIPASPT
jgi:hypothetical protein